MRPFKNAICLAHLYGPGWKFGARAMACLRRKGHPLPHRASGRWEWPVREAWAICLDVKNGRLIEL